MQDDKIIVTVVDGIGIVEAKNDLAHFSLQIKSKGENLDSAKGHVEEKTSQFMEILKGLKLNGMELDGEIKTSMSSYKLEHREGSERITAGFQVINTVNWTITVNDSLDQVYKTCLKFDSNMPRPHFSIKNREILSEQATVKAAEAVKEKLNMECRLLGISPDNLKIQNWNFGYEGHLPNQNISGQNYVQYNNGVRGPQGATGPQGSQGFALYSNSVSEPVVMKIGTTYQELLDMKLDPGSVEVRIAVRVNYVWA